MEDVDNQFKSTVLSSIENVNSILYLCIDKDYIRVLKKNDNYLILENYSNPTAELIDEKSVDISEVVFDKIYDFKFFSEIDKYCICFGTTVALFDLDFKFYKQIELQPGVLTARFKNDGIIFLEFYKFSGNRALGVWDFKNDSIKEYTLESYNHYNRSFVIDESNYLLYGTANAFWSGIHIHVLELEKDELFYLKDPNFRCSRSEIECYNIAINSIGDKYIFISDNDHGERPILCCYSLYDQTEPIHELRLFQDNFFLEVNFHTAFLDDDLFVVVSNTDIGVINPQWNTENQDHNFKLFTRDPDSPYSINDNGGQFVYIINNEVIFVKTDNLVKDISHERKSTMENFISDIKNGRYKLWRVHDTSDHIPYEPYENLNFLERLMKNTQRNFRKIFNSRY